MLRVVRILVGLMCIGGPAVLALAKEPNLFYPDRENAGLHHANPPSDAVLNALLTTEQAKSAADLLKNRNHEELRGLFRVVDVRLSDSSAEADEVVVGKSPMSGADCDWFWLVRAESGHSEVILFACGNSLELLEKRTSGYRDVRTTWSSAAGYTLTDVYRFDGSRYTRVHEFTKSERVNP
jgi:hypothetical protein